MVRRGLRTQRNRSAGGRGAQRLIIPSQRRLHPPMRAQQAEPSAAPTNWHQRVNSSATALTALAATAALLFTGLSAKQAQDELSNRSKELKITQEGHVTERFTAAVEQLGDNSVDVQLGGVYALQRIMQDSSRDQPAIVNVLTAYVLVHGKERMPARFDAGTAWRPATHVQAALSVLANRNMHLDGTVKMDMHGASIKGANLERGHLSGVDFNDADLTEADLGHADLRKAEFRRADLSGASFSGADLRGASLWGAKTKETDFQDADLRGTLLGWTDLSGAELEGMDLSKGSLHISKLSHANLRDAKLRSVDMVMANLKEADLANSDLSLARMQGANFARANLRGANLAGAELGGADMRTAHGLTVEQVLVARLQSNTRLPSKIARDSRVQKRMKK